MLRHQRDDYGNKADSEHQSLLTRFSPPKPSMYAGVASIFHLPKEFCIKSKAAILALSWTVLVGGLVNPMMGVLHFTLLSFLLVHLDISLAYVVLYFFVALLFMCYPLIGFLADVYCGRFRVIAISLCSIMCFSLVFCVNCVLLFYVTLPNGWAYFTITVCLLCVIGIIVGAAGYRANLVQFGIDQLLDAPSHHQGIFVHWALWSYELLTVVFVALFAKYVCYLNGNYAVFYFVSIFCCSFVLTLLLVFGCWRHHWFYGQPGSINPFKIVIKVLNFARKHKYPLLRSAFTYCDDERPSRLDFGKVKYGGPFTTEQVEDVKTFLRIVGVLLTIGPAFVMDVPTSDVSLLYIGKHVTFDIPGILCDQWRWILMNSGLLRCVVRVIFIPLYMWIIFVLLKRNVPQILCRLGLGITMYIMGIVSILVVDIIGHAHQSGNDTTCIFSLQTFNDSNHTYTSILLPGDIYVSLFTVPYLNMHWSALIPSHIFLAIGPSLVVATACEFISAQSPQSMKGLLLGTFFAICGMFEFLGSLALAPFTSKKVRGDGVLSCLTSYLIIIGIIALIGLVLFFVVAKKYKYRERDDRPYDQRFVIDVYNRYLNQV